MKKNHSVEFPLVGFYNGSIDFEYDNYQITTNSNNNFAAANKQKSYLCNLQLEGISLIVINDGATIEEYQEIANDITLLLSLAVWNDVIYNRQLYFVDSKMNQYILILIAIICDF